MSQPARFAILAYEGIEPIDIGATFGVLSMARRVAPEIEMFVVAAKWGPVRMANDLIIHAHHQYDDCPDADVLIVLGGPGWVEQVRDKETLAFIRDWQAKSIVASVCTGAMILAEAGVLDGLKATTKKEVVNGERPPLRILDQTYSGVDAIEARFVDTGPVVTGGGVSLAMDVTLRLIERTCGARVAEETARIMEYSAALDANEQRLKAWVD